MTSTPPRNPNSPNHQHPSIMPTVKQYDPHEAIPHLEGKTILITGGTAGLGAQIFAQLAAHHPSRIYITGRNAFNAQRLIAQEQGPAGTNTELIFLPCNFASLSAVKNCARQFLEANDRLDILFCNAGVMCLPAGLTDDGYEVQFGTNHMGHALLVKLLMPTIVKTAEQEGDARIVWTSSQAFQLVKDLPLESAKTDQKKGFEFLGRWTRYGEYELSLVAGPNVYAGNSKLANVVYAQELAKRYPTVTCTSVHPGIISTGLVKDRVFADRLLISATTFWRQSTPQDGAKSALWAGTAPKVSHAYCFDVC